MKFFKCLTYAVPISILLWVLIIGGCKEVVYGQQQQQGYKVYTPQQVVVPKYEVKPRPDGSYAVYPAGKSVVPIKIIKPAPVGPGQSGYKIYPSGKPVIPIGEVK